MVEVFKTNIQYIEQSTRVIWGLQQRFPEYCINVDLEDCDRILRIETKGYILAQPVIDQINRLGFFAEILLN